LIYELESELIFNISY